MLQNDMESRVIATYLHFLTWTGSISQTGEFACSLEIVEWGLLLQPIEGLASSLPIVLIDAIKFTVKFIMK